MARETLAIENAHVVFRNFSGRPGQYNKDGKRDFVILLDREQGERLEQQGWNIKWLEPRDPDDAPTPSLRIAVNFDNMPPKIVLVTSRNRVLLDEDEVAVLDTADIESADIIVTPYNWNVNGRTGRKAYLKAMYVTIAEDEFAAKYEDLPM